jgi:hypothetical protein
LDQNPGKSGILLYQTEDGKQRIEVRLEDETVWLSQRLLSELFQKDIRTINDHIKNIYDEGECKREGTVRNFRIVQKESSRQVFRQIDFYNLEKIISPRISTDTHGEKRKIWFRGLNELRGYSIPFVCFTIVLFMIRQLKKMFMLIELA